MQNAKIPLMLLKTAIFTAIAPFTVGLWLPTQLHRAFDGPKYGRLDTLAVIPSFILLVAGTAIYLWCAWDFSVKGLGTPAPIDAPKNLVVKGLYRFVRNPMYVGVFCLIASRAVYFWSFAVVLYLVFVATCVQLFIVFYEEPTLRKVFGEQYLEYCQRVPRWIPRIRATR
jgi:protein-S-isoprenylcysteine O-methyltransferase Ste14